MKLILIILFTLITILLSSPIDSGEEDQEPNFKFKIIYDRIIKTVDDETDYDNNTARIKKFDRECLNEKVNLTMNEEKLVPEIPSLYFVLTSVVLCSKEFDLINHQLLDKNIVKFTNVTNKEDNMNCMKAKLQQLESKSDNLMEESCSEFNDNYKEVTYAVRNIFEWLDKSKVIECTGFNVTEKYIKMLKLAIFAMENPDDNDSYKLQRNSYTEDIKRMNVKIYNCLLDIIFPN